MGLLNQREEKGIHKTRETREEGRRLESTCPSPGNEPRTPGKEAEMKRRSSEGERERNKKRDGKAEHTHALRPESIFREGVTSLGLPKAHSAPGKPKEFAIGRGCVSESK